MKFNNHKKETAEQKKLRKEAEKEAKRKEPATYNVNISDA